MTHFLIQTDEYPFGYCIYGDAPNGPICVAIKEAEWIDWQNQNERRLTLGTTWQTGQQYAVNARIYMGGVEFRAKVDHLSTIFTKDCENNCWENLDQNLFPNIHSAYNESLDLAWGDKNGK